METTTPPEAREALTREEVVLVPVSTLLKLLGEAYNRAFVALPRPDLELRSGNLRLTWTTSEAVKPKTGGKS